MAQTNKSTNDYWQASFGEHSEAVPTSSVNGLIVGGVYNATPPTIADGEFSQAQVSAAGNLMVDIVGGEIIASLGTVKLLEAGTVSEVTNLAGGTVEVSSIAGDLTGGTIDEVTEVANLAKGTVTAVEALPDLPGGTVDEVTSVTEVANLAKGTVTSVEGGTVDTNAIPIAHADEFSTTVSSGTSVMGTIKPLVSGSAIYITDLIVSAGGATNVEIASGGTSTAIIGTLHFAANGGMCAPNFKVYPRTASGSALVYKQSADEALTITCNGYVD